MLTDFHAIRTPIAWHILRAYFLQMCGVGVVRVVFIHSFCEDSSGNFAETTGCHLGMWQSLPCWVTACTTRQERKGYSGRPQQRNMLCILFCIKHVKENFRQSFLNGMVGDHFLHAFSFLPSPPQASSFPQNPFSRT